ncbi:MAG: hypothetical protein WDM90_19130 [Ferruginibacter sp.]
MFKNGESDDSVLIRKTKQQLMGIVDAIHKNFNDSISKPDTRNPKMVLSINNATVTYRNDSLKTESTTDGKNRMIQILYGIDSLQDSVKYSDIIAAVQKSFKEEKLPVTFSIINVPTIQLNDSIEKLDKHFDATEPMDEVILDLHILLLTNCN